MIPSVELSSAAALIAQANGLASNSLNGLIASTSGQIPVALGALVSPYPALEKAA